MSGQRPGGVGQYFEGGDFTGSCVEVHASTCAHCQHVSEFPSMRKMHEHVDVCRSCMNLVCLACAGLPCMPYDATATREERIASIKARIEDRWSRA